MSEAETEKRIDWNYRVIRRDSGIGPYYAIHEVYYDAEGRVFAATEDPVPVDGATLKEVAATRTKMLEALRRPVLEYEDFPRLGSEAVT